MELCDTFKIDKFNKNCLPETFFTINVVYKL